MTLISLSRSTVKCEATDEKMPKKSLGGYFLPRPVHGLIYIRIATSGIFRILEKETPSNMLILL